MKRPRNIKFIANAVRWFDKVYGNTYHSVRVTRCCDGAVIVAPFQYGYGDHYRQTALIKMLESGWLNNTRRKPFEKYKGEKYTEKTVFSFERENNYPIMWNVHNGLKRECVANGRE